MQLTPSVLAALAIALGLPAQAVVVPSHTAQHGHTPAHAHASPKASQAHATGIQLESRDLSPVIAGILGLIGGLLNDVPGVLNTTSGLLASLLLVQQPSEGNETTSYIMAASVNSSTPIYMVQSPSTTLDAGSDQVPVMIHVPMYDEVEAAMVDRCLTYDPSPEDSSTLSAAPCSSDSSDVHASQDFLYNTVTSVVSPVFAAAVDDPATNATASNSTAPAAQAAYIIDAALPNADDASGSLAGNATNATSSILIVFTPTTSILLAAPDITSTSTDSSDPNGSEASGDDSKDSDDDEDEDGTDADFTDAAVHNDEECSS